MALNPPRKGLRVFHNSRVLQHVELGIPAGAEITADVYVVEQLMEASTHFEVDRDALAALKAEEAQVAADAAKAENAEPVDDGFPCDDCDFVAKSQGGLTRHQNATHE